MIGRELVLGDIVIRGADYAAAPRQSLQADLCISRGRIGTIAGRVPRTAGCIASDLSGYLLLPGLINAHDHLEFSLYPNLGWPPYRNYIEWGEDIHARCADRIATQHRVPKDVRLLLGGLRNLLCGVTTVCHHNPLYQILRRSDFPVRVVQKYGWAHSAALGGDLRAVRTKTPACRPFIVHACEGVDDLAREEARHLDEIGILDEFAVLVHGLALDEQGVALLCERGSSLVLCPSSNWFLFGKIPDRSRLGRIARIALGSDSPLTAIGDLLDEIRFGTAVCGIQPQQAYRMVTSQAAAILRLQNGEGSITEGGIADVIAFAANGCEPAERLGSASMEDVEMVMKGGIVQLASEAVLERLPPEASRGLEPLLVGGLERWVRAPVQQLLNKAEEVLGENQVCLSGRKLALAACVEALHGR